MRSPRALPDRCLSTQTGEGILARTLRGEETFFDFARCVKGPSRNNRDNWEAQICDRGKARRGSLAGLCDRGATPPRAKDGPPPGGPLTLLGSAGVAHRFHTPGMRALRSLARSKIVSANCPGYFVTDPKDLRENNLINIAPRFGLDLDGTIEKNSRHSTAMVRVFRLRLVQPRNGSWAQKRRVRNWCAWCNTKSRGHLGGDETVFYCASYAKSLRRLL